MQDIRQQWDNLKPPRPPHGRRLLIPQIDIIARKEPHRPWISVPVNEQDLSQGYKDITFEQLANATNTTAHWLRDNLRLPSSNFPTFAYSGPSDYGYALMAVAAGKLGYQIVPFGRSIGPAGQQKIMQQKDCAVYLYAPGSESAAQQVQRIDSSVRIVCAPELKELVRPDIAEPVEYSKSWEEAKDDPWLVLHTSGTTGFPKAITYTQQRMSTVDIVRGLKDDLGDNALENYIKGRLYLPMPPMHYVSLFITLGTSVWGNVVPVYGPGGIIPSPPVVKQILEFGNIEGAILVPALIDALCQDPSSLSLLRKLKYIQYAGAPLSTTTGRLLASDVRIVPAIGSTDAGAYFVGNPNKTKDWDYISLQPHSGAVMEHRVDNLYELVFIQHPKCAVQSMFEGRPDLERFETQDLWVEHASKKGQWKLVGRSDDLIKLDNGFGVIVTPIEMLVSDHPYVKSALVGGHGRPQPIALIEPIPAKNEELTTPEGRADFIKTLSPHIGTVNQQFNQLAHIDTRLIILATPDKPWPLTMKDTPIRSQVLRLYAPEVEQAYRALV